MRTLILGLALSLIYLVPSKSQNMDSTSLSPPVSLQEVVLEHAVDRKVTGLLSGTITLHSEGVQSLPSLMGNTDLLKLLELMPGVQTSGDGNSNQYIRGGDPGQNLLSYNQVRLYTPGHMLSFFPLFNADHIASVKLMKTGVDARYGGFLSAAIDATSKTQLPSKYGVQGSIGLLSSQATVSLPIGEKWGAYISGRSSYIQLLLMPILNATVDKKTRDNPMKYDFHDGNLTLVGLLTSKTQLLVNVFSSSDALEIADPSINLEGSLNWTNTVLSAQLETQWETIKLQQGVWFSAYQNQLTSKQSELQIDLLSKVQDVGYQNQLSYSIAQIHFTSGLSLVDHQVIPQGIQLQNISMEGASNSSGITNAQDVSVFTSARWNITPHLLLHPGIRFNLYHAQLPETVSSKTFQSVDLRFAGRYELDASRFLRASFSHNNQYLNKLTPSSVGLPTDFWVSASSTIKPQVGNEASVGYYQSLFNGAFEWSSDLYYRTMQGVTEYNMNFIESGQTSFTDKINYGRGRAYGLEFLFKKNSGKWTGWLSYSWGKSTRSFPQIDNGNTFPSRFDRRHDLSLVSTYTFNPHWDASLVYIFATGNTYTQPTSWYFINNTPVRDYNQYNNARMPNYNRTDISINYWFHKDNGINFSIHNLFMVLNPTYIFFIVSRNTSTKQLQIGVRQKKLLSIVPSISWRFKF